jgi:beta-mannosidase
VVYSSRRDLLKAGLAVSASSLLPASTFVPSIGSTDKPAESHTLLLGDNEWRLGSFAFGEGGRHQAYSTGFNDSSFRSVKVPGEVQLQIGLEGMDLYYQSKEVTLVNQQEWWYRKRFSVPGEFSGKTLRLVFDGVDYFATVWLNGKKLGEHEGAYVPFEFDLTGKVLLNEQNQLAVKVTCPWLPEGRGFLEYMKGELAEVVPHIVVSFPTAPYVLGPNWDGIPAGGNAVFPMGLFRDVRLEASGSTIVSDLFVRTKSINANGEATLAITGSIRSYSDERVPVSLEIKVAPENFEGPALVVSQKTLEVHPGENNFNDATTLKNARLWWTWDTGEQNLYKATATISSIHGTESESREAVFGIRSITRQDNMSYWINGKRLFLKGAWYPIADIFGSKPTRETYETDLLLYRAANLNHLVNFTVVEKPDFYELCDRLGILNFFEFPFTQFGPMAVLSRDNPRRETFIKESLSQVRQILILLRNHPSIVLWDPFAEARMGGKGWGALGEDFDKYGYQEFVDEIKTVVEEEAPGTIFHPSFCDVGEHHFWMGNANWTGDEVANYNEHFYANAEFVSEYGTIALPVLQTLQKILTPQEMWSSQNSSSPRWYNLPIDVSAYSYQTSFDYVGFTGLLDRVNQFIDRNIKSVDELIDGSQLYQAFIFKYATEVFRRRKYNSINGTRIWAYGELCPGIRFNFLDYYRIPKMGYYFLRNAQARFAVNFAYEEALESQPCGKKLQIPVWAVNDHSRGVPLVLKCRISELSGHTIWSKEFRGDIGSDNSKELGVVDWVTPEKAGVYCLQAQVSEEGGPLRAADRTFIKVTPRLFSRALRILLIGQRKYSLPIARMVQGMGLGVEVIDEQTIHQLAALREPDKVHAQYDVVWLASFDSIWKLLHAEEAEGLKQAISEGVGFIHSGGPGSFHGGSMQAALLDFTPLAEALPVKLYSRDDLFLSPSILGAVGDMQIHPPSQNIRLASGAAEEWESATLNDHGLDGFNRVELMPESQAVMTIMDKPLLVTGRFKNGRTLAFTGFTPEYVETRASWNNNAIFPYLLDQEFVSNPKAKIYFSLFMKMIAKVTGEMPATPYKEILDARSKPLFETLKDQPTATLQPAKGVQATVSGSSARGSLTLLNGSHYARLVRIRAEWHVPDAHAPYAALYGDNYFDLMPEESRDISLEFCLPSAAEGLVSGHLTVEGTNLEALKVPITLSRADR